MSTQPAPPTKAPPPPPKPAVKSVDHINDLAAQTEPTQYVPAPPDTTPQDLWNNNIIWEFVKTLRPGTDLTRIPFPVCICQPRSLLQSITDYFAHWDLLSLAANADDPYIRMKLVTQWYISGFSKAMKLVRKPYNPILGEVYRCMWTGASGSRTHFVAEQVSHHPPCSAFYLSNRQDGWLASGTIAFTVSFYGLSAWAYLNGVQRIKLLKYDEEYLWSFPPTKASGFFIGPFIMEMGGVITIRCAKNPFSTELDFKTQGMFSSADLYRVVGKIVRDGKVVDTIDGKYFETVRINKDVFFDAKQQPAAPQLFVVPPEKQWGRESEVVWHELTAAINKGDSELAGQKKHDVEQWQRDERAEAERTGKTFVPRLFERNPDGDGYRYVYENTLPFDPDEEEAVEIGGVVTSRRKNG